MDHIRRTRSIFPQVLFISLSSEKKIWIFLYFKTKGVVNFDIKPLGAHYYNNDIFALHGKIRIDTLGDNLIGCFIRLFPFTYILKIDI